MSETVTEPVEMEMPHEAAAAPKLMGPKGEVGPVCDEETGEYTHWGEHSTQIIHGGGNIVTIHHGESFIPAKDGSPAIILRRVKE